MRKLLIWIALAVLLVTLTGIVQSCKAEIDKAKIATMLAGFVLDQLQGKQFDKADLLGMVEVIGVDFIEANADEIREKYHDQTLGFVRWVWPQLIDRLGAELGDGTVVILGPQAGDDDAYADNVAKFLLSEFNEYEGVK